MPFEVFHTEKELLHLAAQGNEAAFTSLFNRHKDRLFNFLFHLTTSPEMTEDIIQDTFLKLWKEREILNTIDHFSSYLFRMTRNLSINAFKRMAKETLILSELKLRTADVNMESERNIEFKEVRKLLHETLEKLPPQQKLIFTLSREQGLKHEEIAQQLNIAPSTVKNHMVQALHKIREKLRFNSNSIAGFYLLIQLSDILILC